MNQTLKKNAPQIAGIAFILYALLAFLRGVEGFLPVAFQVALVALGVACLIEKTNPARFGLLCALAVISLFILGGDFLALLKLAIRGYMTFARLVYFALGMFSTVLELLAFGATAALVFLFWKRKTNALAKFWYVPAALVVLSGAVSCFSVLFLNILYTTGSVAMIGRLFLAMVQALILAIGLAALAIHSQTEE